MPVHKSSIKRMRQTARKTAVNKSRTSSIRGAVKKAEEAIAAGDKANAKKLLQAAEGALRRGAQKGLVEANAAARKTSRLTKRLKALS